MKPKEKIIRILEENCVNFIYSDDESFNIDGVDKDNFNEVAKQIVEKLTTTDVSQQSEVLPEFLTKDSYGKIVTAYIGGADVTKEWNEYLSNCS